MEPNEPPPRQPPVVRWFKIYAALSAVLYLVPTALCLGLMFIELFIDPELLEENSLVTLKISSSLLLLLTVPMTILHVLPLFLGRSPRAWKFGLFLICLGIAGPCIPITAPMLKYWSTAETKAYFGIIE